MIFFIFIALCTIALPIAGSLTFWPVQHAYDFYIPIVLLIAGYIGSTALSLILVFAFSLPFTKKKQYKKPSGWCRFWLQNAEQYIIFLSRTKVKVIGYSRIPKNEKFLLVCNHRSNFDPMIITAKWGKLGIAFISKKQNFDIPFVNRLMSGMCYMPIDKDDALQSLAVMKRSAELIANGICSIGVFPEGKRQHDDIVIPFHEGVFNIAIRTKAPIVVCTVNDAYQIQARFPWKRTKVTLKVLEILRADEYEGKTAKEVSDYASELMVDELTSHKVTY